MSQPQNAETTFIHPRDRLWSLYLSDAEKHDKVRLERWKGDTDGILIFTGLFAATVATFVVSSLPSLSPDTGEQAVAILAQILVAQTSEPPASQNPTLPMVSAFEASHSALWINTLWLVSLSVALMCALAATLVQQSARIYAQQVQRRGHPGVRGPIYAALALSVKHYRVEDAISLIVTLLHVAVFLFFSGLLLQLFSVNIHVGVALTAFLCSGALGYTVISILPVITPRSPYRTPLSPALKHILSAALALYAHLLVFFGRIYEIFDKVRHIRRPIVGSTARIAGPELDRRAQAVRAALRQISMNSLTAGPSAWNLRDWTRSHCYALNQVHKSVDELFEAEIFCESLIPFIGLPTNDDIQTKTRSFELCKFAIRNLKVFDLIARLIESCSSLDTSQVALTDADSSRRIIAAMSLARSFLRWCLPPEMLLHRPAPRRLLVEERAVSGDTAEILSSLLQSRLHGCLRVSPLAPLHSQSASTLFSCFLAALRADLLTAAIQEETLGAGLDSAKWNVTELYEGPVIVSLHSWLHEIDYFDDTSETLPHARHTLLDNFLWIYDWITDVGMHPDGLAILDTTQSLWLPLVEHAYKAALFYLPRMPIGDDPDSPQTHPSVLDLRALVRKLGLDRDSDADAHDGWLSKAVNYALIKVYPGYQRLFRQHTYFGDWLSTLCSRIEREKLTEEKPSAGKPKLQLRVVNADPKSGSGSDSDSEDDKEGTPRIEPSDERRGSSHLRLPQPMRGFLAIRQHAKQLSGPIDIDDTDGHDVQGVAKAHPLDVSGYDDVSTIMDYYGKH